MAEIRPTAEIPPGQTIILDGEPINYKPVGNLSACPECCGPLVVGCREGETTPLYLCLNASCGWGPSAYMPGRCTS